jgi:epoxyqueuosine reductase
MLPEEKAAVIRKHADRLGFDQVRFCAVKRGLGIGEYDGFLAKGNHGEMKWMVRSRPPREKPQLLLPEVKSAAVLGVGYHWPMPPDPGGMTGRVSRYAWGRDYHNLIGKRLKKMGRALSEDLPGLGHYFGVDSRPIIERAWGESSGLGFIGKNCMLIQPGKTSFFFLAVIFLTEELPVDPSIAMDHCGRCRRCLDVCPTKAFTGPFQLDARRCISYLTIEHPHAIPVEHRSAIGRWFFGCDLCQEVCPHNNRPPESRHRDLAPRPGHAWVDLEWILFSEDEVIADHFIGTPLRRAGPIRLKRNAAVVLGNIGNPEAKNALDHTLQHPNEMLREHARWALDRIG